MEIKENTPQAQARTLLRLGISAVERGDAERALRYVRGALTVDPECIAASLWVRALDGQDPAMCREDLKAAQASFPDEIGLAELEAWLDEHASTSHNKATSHKVRVPWEHLMRPQVQEDLASHEDETMAETPVYPGEDSSTDQDAPEEQGHNRRRVMASVCMVLMIGYILLATGLFFAATSSQTWQNRLQGWLGIGPALAMQVETPLPSPSPTTVPTATMAPTSTPTQTLTPAPTSTPTLTPTPAWVTDVYAPLPLEEKWIEVDLSDQMLYAYEGTECVFESLVSTGKEGTPTRRGRFRIQTKYPSQDMGGAGYYLPNVQYVQYFYINFAIHSAYWHDSWGTPTSHGCVNMVTEDAEWLFGWTDPVFEDGANVVRATTDNPGTWVLIHD